MSERCVSELLFLLDTVLSLGRDKGCYMLYLSSTVFTVFKINVGEEDIFDEDIGICLFLKSLSFVEAKQDIKLTYSF